MDSQTKTHSTSSVRACQNCKRDFTIEPDDFAFYEKIKVPPPTWCPECRMVRRMSFFNERSLYKNACALCGKNIVALFPSTTHKIVYCPQCWWSDKWEPLDYGREVDFSRPFLEQFRELHRDVPEIARQNMENTLVNSEYVSNVSYAKNCYLIFNSDYDEDCFYSTYLERSKWCTDIYWGDECELCYEGINLNKCFKTIFSIDCQNCVEVAFSKNLHGCSNCFGCVNLRNKQYYIFNTPYTKEDYFKKLGKYDYSSYSISRDFLNKLKAADLIAPHRYMEGIKNKNVSGDYISNSKNVHFGYQVLGAEDSKYCHFLFIAPAKDTYDLTMWGGGVERMYECMGAGNGQNDVKFTFETWANAMHMEYCCNILASNSYLFGYDALKNKKYCILNKQYTKEEYERLISKIIQHMNDMPYIDKKGRTYKYGEFFPLEFSPFGYNESIAHDHFQITKTEAISQGYNWNDPEERNYEIQISTDKIPDNIKDVSEDIIGQVIECEHEGNCNERCVGAFKIIQPELQFYKKMNLPLPRLCPNCRHYQRLAQRNPLKLWHRRCMKPGCPNEFETSYAPERPEIIYCESHYNAEVS